MKYMAETAIKTTNKVQVISNVGTSEWSDTASFSMAITPPLAPVPVAPVGISVGAANGVLLEWIYNSEYDTKPSRFDVEYRKDNGVWKSMSNQGQVNILIPAAEFEDGERHTLEWRVKAYGEYGDASPWSEIVTFWTVGAPRRPVIVEVTNANLPTVYFAAENLLSWELEIVQNGKVIYATGTKPFKNELFYKLTDFIPNGNYVARLRIINEYGLYSGWSELAFTISVTPPEPLYIRLHHNTVYHIRLSYDNGGQIVYIYRAQIPEPYAGTVSVSDYKRIAKTTANIFDDYTAAPGVRYGYFTRIVDDNGGYADSNIVTGTLDFKETTLAACDDLGNMLLLAYNLGQKPIKNAMVTHEKTLTQLVGRAFPLLQVGEHRDRSVDYTFYCNAAERARLEELAAAGNILLLRDWRYGAIFGTIDGNVAASIETKGFIVSFSFRQCDYGEEITLT